MKNDFNSVAKWYQFISRAVFGDALLQAQVLNLSALEKGHKVLMVGGGDGELLKHFPEDLNLQIDYVELSQQMLELAQLKAGNHRISFVQRDIFEHEGQYDVIISNFFLDCFGEQTLPEVIKHLGSLLRPKGLLMVVDFAPPQTSLDRMMLWAMHRFFKVFSKLDSNRLQPIHKKIMQNRFDIIRYSERSKPRLFAAVYQAT